MCILLCLFVLAAYWQVQRNDFINYDDELYVTQNPHLKGGLTFKNIGWAFSTRYAANWHPVTWLSHMLDDELYGLDPAGHHWTNVQIHLANTVLLFLVFTWMTGAFWPSSFVAAFFALHPLHVESVAWVAERKDVLCAFFWILSMWAYGRYVRRSRTLDYVLLILFYSLGLMAKPMIITLPFVLLLLDFWPLNRFPPGERLQPIPLGQNLKGLIWEKIPLFALSVVSGIITFSAQQSGGAVVSLDSIPLKIRIANTLVSYLHYLAKMLWPLKLSVFYPYRQWPFWYAVISGMLILILSLCAVRAARRYPWFFVGWFWYLGTFLPVIGLVHAGAQGMADRYTYIPLIGMSVVIGWGIAAAVQRLKYQTAVISLLAVGMLVACIMTTRSQVGYWKNTITLFSRALDVTPDNPVALFSLGYGFQKQGKFDKAYGYYVRTLKISPEYKNAHNNIGLIMVHEGKINAAIDQYHAELRRYPESADTHNNLANALVALGKLPEAARHYQMALKFNPEHANAHYNLGNLFLGQEKFKDAIKHLAAAIRIKPDFAAAYNQIGIILVKQNKIEKAAVFFSRAIQINPAYEKARKNLETMMQLKKKYGNTEKKTVSDTK